jgi:transketolase
VANLNSISATTKPATRLDDLSVNTIRFLSVDAVQKANSGHPGLPLDAAPMAYVIWTRFLKHNPTDPQWFDRDRFILSAGHGSMLLYSMLYLTGYDLSLDDIKNFRQWGSKTPGHPEKGLTPGVETTTGPLGQGFGNGVGMAIAEAYLAARYNRPGIDLIHHYTYSIVSDGDLMEGVASEAASIAGDLKLGRLIYLYDNNKVTLSAGTDITFCEDAAKRFQAYGWQTITIEDGNDLDAITQAVQTAREESQRPSLILVRTHLGYGSPNKQDTFEAHGSPLGENEVRLTKENLGWPVDPPFYIPDDALQHFRSAVVGGKQAQQAWNSLFERYTSQYPDEAKELRTMIDKLLPTAWDKDLPHFPADLKGMATRAASGKVMNSFTKRLPGFIGGSADLDPSTYTALTGEGDFEPPVDNSKERDTQGSAGGGWSYAGKNIHYGVREHAMGAISNGIGSFQGLIPFASTFLIFSDYMRPPIRLAAIQSLQVIYVYTHDSIGLGQDGPTHQPVEQLANLRAVPNLLVIRPGDANETRVAWQVAIENRSRPTALVLSRQNVPTFDRALVASEDGLRKGAYVLAEAQGGQPDLILIGTGSELQLTVEAQKLLAQKGLRTRVVSMPCWRLFDEQPVAYRESVLPPGISVRLVVEAGVSQGWDRYVGADGDVIGVDRFGASAPAEVIFHEYGFTVENVVAKALTLVHRLKEKSHAGNQ